MAAIEVVASKEASAEGVVARPTDTVAVVAVEVLVMEMADAFSELSSLIKIFTKLTHGVLGFCKICVFTASICRQVN